MAKKRRKNIKKHGDQFQDKNEEVNFLEDAPVNESDNNHEETIEVSEVNPLHEVTTPVTPTEIEEAKVDIEVENPPFEVVEEQVEESFQQPGVLIGSYLKEKREEQGISLKNISQSTKIGLTKLEHLESDNYHDLPDKVYVIGYVKNYAKILGLDQEYCLELLRQIYDGGPTQDHLSMLASAEERPIRESNLPIQQILIGIAGVVLVIGLGYFIVQKVKDYSASRNEEVSKEIKTQTLSAETPLKEEIENNIIENNTDTSATTPQKTPVVEEKKEEAKKEEVKVAEKKKEEPKKEEKKKEEKKEEPKQKFYPLASSLYTSDTSMSQEEINQMIPSNFRNSLISGKQNIFIKAVKGNSWLTYKADGNPIKKFVLQEGRGILIRGEEARIFLGNLGAVKVFLNNKPLTITSRSGVKSLVFPQENGKNYVLPLFIYKTDGSVQTSEEYLNEIEGGDL